MSLKARKGVLGQTVCGLCSSRSSQSGLRAAEALAAEQGNPIPENPMVFFKPTSAYITEGQEIRVPPRCQQLYHEVELGVVIGQRASGLTQARAMDAVAGYALCLDMTAWDLQCAAKAGRKPWGVSKGFDTACPVSGFIPKEKIQDVGDVRLWLKVNGVIKQDSSTSDMIFPVPEVISYVSEYFTLEPGDIILTGSPAGAGPVSRGDTIEAGLHVREAELMKISFQVAK